MTIEDQHANRVHVGLIDELRSKFKEKINKKKKRRFYHQQNENMVALSFAAAYGFNLTSS